MTDALDQLKFFSPKVGSQWRVETLGVAVRVVEGAVYLAQVRSQ